MRTNHEEKRHNTKKKDIKINKFDFYQIRTPAIPFNVQYTDKRFKH